MIKPEIDSAIARVMESGQFTLGKEVETFEQEFSAYNEVKFAVGVNSGTSALHLALLAADIAIGDDVITVSHTFVATIAAILYVGARPILVDIDPSTYTMNVDQIENAITPRTKAILPVHLYGHPADMDPILEIAHKYDLVVIEDAAQAIGAKYKGRRVGGIGDLGCFSFYPSKNLGAYGEGGAVVTNDPIYADKIRMLRNWRSKKRGYYDVNAYNYRLDEIQAAILCVKLNHLDGWNELRRKHASYYNDLLRHSKMQLPIAKSYAEHVYHLYVVRTSQRDAIQQALASRGIQTLIHYPVPIHKQKFFNGILDACFPVTETCAAEVLSLPMYPEITDEILKVISSTIINFTRQGFTYS